METRKLVIINKPVELEQIQLFLEQLGKDWSLPSGFIFELNLVLEEYVVNLINYAYSEDDEHEIIIEINKKDDQLKIVVTDDGKPFNILEIPENDDLDKPLSDRKIGGLGVHFIRKFTDRLEYLSEDGKNKILMLKTVR